MLPIRSTSYQAVLAVMSIPTTPSGSSFIDLPPEVLLTIFDFQESFRDISCLFRTCKRLYVLWQSRASSISKPLLIRQTPCYEDVEVLAMAHEAVQFASDSQIECHTPDQDLAYRLQKTLYRLAISRQITSHAKYLCDIIELRYLQQKYNCDEARCRARASTLVPQERDEIIRTHHFIKLYALTYQNTTLTDLHSRCETKLRNMSTADKHFVFQLVRIMHDYSLPWDKMRLGLIRSFSPFGIVNFDTACPGPWAERFSALRQATRVPVTTCQNCIYDDTARFSRLEQGQME